jgi:hypothetical protein
MDQMDRVVESAGPLLEPFAESPRGSGTLNHTRGCLALSRRPRGNGVTAPAIPRQVLAGRFVSVPDTDKCLEPADGQSLGGPGLDAFWCGYASLPTPSNLSHPLTGSNQAFT